MTIGSLADYGAVPDRDMTALLHSLICDEPLGEREHALIAVATAQGVERGLVRLLPLLQHHRDFASLPPEIRQCIEAERRQAQLRHIMLARTAEQLSAAFAADGIAALFLKGFALGATVYASPADRPMTDLDIAVHPAAFAAASAILANLGFAEKSDRAMALGPGRHAATFKHPASRCIVDLHQHVLAFSRWASADDGFWRRALRFAPAGDAALTLAPEDHLLQACLHGYAHHASHSPFRWMIDACKLIEQNRTDFRWEILLEEAAHQRCEGVLAAALDFLRENFGAPIPADVRAHLAAALGRANDDAYFRLHGHLTAPSLGMRWRAFVASYRRHGGDARPGPLGLLRWAGERWQTASLSGTLLESLRRLPQAESDRRKRRQGVAAAKETQRLRQALTIKRDP